MSHGDGRQFEFPIVLPHSGMYRTKPVKNNRTAALVVQNGFWSVERRQALPEGNLPRNSRLQDGKPLRNDGRNNNLPGTACNATTAGRPGRFSTGLAKGSHLHSGGSVSERTCVSG